MEAKNHPYNDQKTVQFPMKSAHNKNYLPKIKLRRWLFYQNKVVQEGSKLTCMPAGM